MASGGSANGDPHGLDTWADGVYKNFCDDIVKVRRVPLSVATRGPEFVQRAPGRVGMLCRVICIGTDPKTTDRIQLLEQTVLAVIQMLFDEKKQRKDVRLAHWVLEHITELGVEREWRANNVRRVKQKLLQKLYDGCERLDKELEKMAVAKCGEESESDDF